MIQDEFVFVSPQIMIRFAHLLWHRGSTVYASRCCLPKSAHNVYNCSNTCIFCREKSCKLQFLTFQFFMKKSPLHQRCEPFNPPIFVVLLVSVGGVDRGRWCHWQEHNDWCTSMLFSPMRKMMDIVDTLPELTGLHLKIGRARKGKGQFVFNNHQFSGCKLAISFWECNFWFGVLNPGLVWLVSKILGRFEISWIDICVWLVVSC